MSDTNPLHSVISILIVWVGVYQYYLDIYFILTYIYVYTNMGPIRKNNDNGASQMCKNHMLDGNILESM
jgi:hypothetical protein